MIKTLLTFASRDEGYEEGYEVDVVHDGADGLDAALTGGYDLIVLDLMLPSLSGLELSLCPASGLTGEAEGAT